MGHQNLSVVKEQQQSRCGLGRVPEMAEMFHGPVKRHQHAPKHQVEEDRQRKKGESPVSVPGQQRSNNKKEKKKNNSEEDDLTYGTRDCDIGKSSSMKLYLLLLCENSTRQHLVTTAMVDRIKAGILDMDYFCLGCHVEVCAIRCNRECKVSCVICDSTGDYLLVCENSSCFRKKF
ncbi:hypothetical protein DAPPUDRAFT_108389 [Daphnia pulex]|uniref:Uncharacterized protein n=1 Tax=Daphnia pulex TaxID=6669 RepID=E9H021_DAPPU|nr:hypothetical protein DAPPUDRAFT_108389 [Daphnia pulex]|eukprot:EFX74962.1 hypothetical protein DAPPUDRAFT_108389 [Daphnia pulex]